jgi:hypothetical protein
MATWREIKAQIEALGVHDDDEVAWMEFIGLPAYAERSPDKWDGKWIVGD